MLCFQGHGLLTLYTTLLFVFYSKVVTLKSNFQWRYRGLRTVLLPTTTRVTELADILRRGQAFPPEAAPPSPPNLVQLAAVAAGLVNPPVGYIWGGLPPTVPPLSEAEEEEAKGGAAPSQQPAADAENPEESATSPAGYLVF